MQVEDLIINNKPFISLLIAYATTMIYIYVFLKLDYINRINKINGILNKLILDIEEITYKREAYIKTIVNKTIVENDLVNCINEGFISQNNKIQRMKKSMAIINKKINKLKEE